MGDHHGGAALGLELIDRGLDLDRQLVIGLGHHPDAAHQDDLTIHRRADAAARDGLEVGRHAARVRSDQFGEIADDGSRQRVVAQRLGSQGDRIEFIDEDAWCWDGVGYRGVSPGEGAGLVEGHGVDLAESLQRGTALDQDAGAASTSDPRQHSCWGCDRQGAGAGRDQDQHRPVEAVTERLGRPDHPDRQHHDHGQDDRGHIEPLEPVDEPLGGRLGCVSLGDELHHPRQCGVGGRCGHHHVERAGAVHRPGEDPRATGDRVGIGQGLGDVGHCSLLHRDRLPGHRGLVDRRAADADETIRRYPRVRSHDRDIAHLKLFHRTLNKLVRADAERGRAGCELAQRLDRASRAGHRVLLQGVSEAEQEQQHGTLGEPADRCCTGGGHDHQEVHFEPAPADRAPRPPHGEEAPTEVGRKIQAQHQRFRGTKAELSDQPRDVGHAGGDSEVQLPPALSVGVVFVIFMRSTHDLNIS